MIAYPVLLVAVVWLAGFAAYITTAIGAETDTRVDHGHGRLVWVWVNVPSRAAHLPVPLCPPMHYQPLRARVEEVGRPLPYGRPPADVVGAVRRAA